MKEWQAKGERVGEEGVRRVRGDRGRSTVDGRKETKQGQAQQFSLFLTFWRNRYSPTEVRI